MITVRNIQVIFLKFIIDKDWALVPNCYSGIIITSNILKIVSQDSIVAIATSYGLDDRGIGLRVLVGSRIFSISSRPALGPTQPLSNGYRGLFPRGKATEA
jgi:hypothetical protein